MWWRQRMGGCFCSLSMSKHRKPASFTFIYLTVFAFIISWWFSICETSTKIRHAWFSKSSDKSKSAYSRRFEFFYVYVSQPYFTRQLQIPERRWWMVIWWNQWSLVWFELSVCHWFRNITNQRTKSTSKSKQHFIVRLRTGDFVEDSLFWRLLYFNNNKSINQSLCFSTSCFKIHHETC